MTGHAPTLVTLVRAHARAELAHLRATTPPAPHAKVTRTVLEQTATGPISLPSGAGWATAETTDGLRAAWVEAPGCTDGLAASA